MALKSKQIDVSKPLEAYDEVLANAKNQGREPNTADRMLAMRAAILAYEADKANVLPPTRGTDSAQVPIDPDDEILRAILAVTSPATYRDYLRHPDNGPHSALQVEKEISIAKRQYAAILAAVAREAANCRGRAQGGDTKDPRK